MVLLVVNYRPAVVHLFVTSAAAIAAPAVVKFTAVFHHKNNHTHYQLFCYEVEMYCPGVRYCFTCHCKALSVIASVTPTVHLAEHCTYYYYYYHYHYIYCLYF